jgi:hypothetical protein
MIYKIEYSKQAEKDIDDLFEVIITVYKAPITAFRYVDGLIQTINSLKRNASVFKYYDSDFGKIYGANVKRINYKKMVILFTVFENVVYIA